MPAGPSVKFNDRFKALSGSYARFRPEYPNEMIEAIAARIAGVSAAADAGVFDVGCGTGIFTRQLARALPSGIGIVGIEPSEDMRQAAIAQSGGLNITFRDGSAEALPAETGTVRAITAATAAHWFNRPLFYAEAERALAPDGIFTIIEYVRDVDNSPAAAAIEDFLVREGGPKAYERPDYEAEIMAVPRLELLDVLRKPVTLPLDIDGFVGLALSSSHAKPIVAKLGEAVARSKLGTIGGALAGADGTVPYGYLFQAFIARRVSL